MPNSPEQEPSIEEILASIRQIISDDDEEAAPAAKAAPPPPPEPEDDDILELTEKLEDEPPPRPQPPVRERVQVDLRDADEDEDEDDDGSILTQHAASAALEGFSKLTSRMPVDREGTGMITLEDIVRELMRPMLREWLDTHLPPIIEKAVTKELDKIARKAMDE